MGNLLTHPAGCCAPEFPDEIIGFITRGRGVTIHTQRCPNALHLMATEPERVIEVSWSGVSEATRTLPVTLTAYDRTGLLRDITLLLSREGVNIDSVQTRTIREEHQVQMMLGLELEESQESDPLLEQLRAIRNVISVTR